MNLSIDSIKKNSADFITTISIVLGFSAIIIASSNLYYSACLILISVLLDGLDGLVARKFGSKSDGKVYDTMADIIAFCVSPSVLIYYSILGFSQYISMSIAILYLISSVYHLRIFIRQDRTIGVQTPVISIGICVSIFMNPIITILISIFGSVMTIIKIEYPEDISNISKIIATILILSLIISVLLSIELIFYISLAILILDVLFIIFAPIRHNNIFIK